MSHAHEDKEKLSNLKSMFSAHGIQLFLAHEDIEGGKYYIETIKTELCNSDIFILYANRNSEDSCFCNQEIGWNLALKKPFITIGNGDWGLMPKQQCYRLKPKKEFECFSSIMKDKRTIQAISKFAQYKKKVKGLNLLKKADYLGFQVHSKKPDNIISLSKKWIHLIPWIDYNNYWFYTIFDVIHTINHQKKKRIYKIGYRGQIGGNPNKCSYTFKEMSKYFLWLPDNFLSRRIDDGNKYTVVDKAISILLRDCEYNQSLKKDFENENFYRKSLLQDECL